MGSINLQANKNSLVPGYLSYAGKYDLFIIIIHLYKCEMIPLQGKPLHLINKSKQIYEFLRASTGM